MRVAFISEHASPAGSLGGEDAGGQNVYIDEIARRLGEIGFQVDVFTRREAPDAPACVAWAPGVRIVNLAVGPAHHIPKDDLWPLMPAFRDELLAFVIRNGIRYDVIHGNFWMSGWVAMELRRLLGVPAVQLFHALGMTKRRNQGTADTSPAARITVERAIMRGVDRVIATCPNERRDLIVDYGAPGSRIDMIPLGVDTDLFRPVDRNAARRRIGQGLAESDTVLVYVGRILPRKDIRCVVQALALLGNTGNVPEQPVKLLVVGGESRLPDETTTPEISQLRQLAADLGVSERVIFTGKRDRHELRDYYSAGDVMVTTPWYEPFGLTPLEAMACARPVIGANVGGISYTVRHNETGLLVPPRSPEALAGAMQSLLADSIGREQLGTAGRRRVVREFTWRVVADRTAKVYSSTREETANRVLTGPTVRPFIAMSGVATSD